MKKYKILRCPEEFYLARPHIYYWRFKRRVKVLEKKDINRILLEKRLEKSRNVDGFHWGIEAHLNL